MLSNISLTIWIMLTVLLSREEQNEIRLKRIRQLSNDLITDQTPSGYMVKRLSAHGGCLGSQRR